MPTIKELYDADKSLQIKTGGDLTPYYSEGNSGKDANLVDEKSISALEKKLSTKRYGAGTGEWGPVYNDSKLYSKITKRD
jgi:hypothetical protein